MKRKLPIDYFYCSYRPKYLELSYLINQILRNRYPYSIFDGIGIPTQLFHCLSLDHPRQTQTYSYHLCTYEKILYC